MPTEDQEKKRARDMLDEAIKEIGRLRHAFFINMIRLGAKEDEINSVLYPHAKR